MSRHLHHLRDDVEALAIELIRRCHERGIDLLIYHTYRTKKEHAELYAQGRTKPGKKVTWTKVSKHCNEDSNGQPASLAFDAVPMKDGKLCMWDRKDLYLIVGLLAQEIGLRWGGNWDQDDKPFEPGETDSPHFELP